MNTFIYGFLALLTSAIVGFIALVMMLWAIVNGSGGIALMSFILLILSAAVFFHGAGKLVRG